LLKEKKEKKKKEKLKITLLIYRLLATINITHSLNIFVYSYIYNQLIAKKDFV